MRGMKTAKKMRLAHYWDVTFLTQIVPSYYFTVTKNPIIPPDDGIFLSSPKSTKYLKWKTTRSLFRRKEAIVI